MVGFWGTTNKKIMKYLIKLSKALLKFTTYIVLLFVLILASFKMYGEGEGLLLFGGTLAAMFIVTNLFDKW